VNLEMHTEIAIERVWRCTCRRQSTGFRDTLGGRDRVNLEMHSKIVIERVCRCTWRPKSCEVGYTLEAVIK